ncbi:ATP-binding protein [Methylocella sp.]|uniref:ATP-binding protein n=1 Tax=Methylocella sp. TaxID=1978226 RepID=UPI0035B1E91E
MAARLEEMSAQNRLLHEHALTLQEEERADAPPLDAVVFRIVQESLSNAVRHANPRVVDVSVEIAGGDGAGFDPARKRNGFGLAGMRERVRSAGGVMSADSRAGGGARVAATLPIRPDEPTARGMAGVLT